VLIAIVLAAVMTLIAVAVIRWLATVVRQLNVVERNYSYNHHPRKKTQT
jgi:type II secretory pathway component PulJ